ncbi:retrovirus-related pol polyprotein from transposon TNT 1-94, partial [Tanacetum coccineum]
ELKCVKCNGCMLSHNHDLCVLDFIKNVNARKKSTSVNKYSKRKVWKPTGKVFSKIGYIWRPTGRTFTIVGNVCPLTRITTTTEVPHKIPSASDNKAPKPVITLVYSRKPRKSKTNVPISKSKVLKSVFANKKEPSPSWGSIVSDVPSSSLDECRSSKLFSVKFRNDHVAKILGYGDYQIGNVTISRVYYVEGLRHNLFSVGQFCDSNLEVTFCQHTYFIHNLEGVDLLIGYRGNNLYTLSLGDMMTSSPICLLSKASKTNVNGKKYILVIVDDVSRFTWVRSLRSKDKAQNFIIKFLKMIQQNGVVERRNHTLIEAARTMLIYAKALLFLWAEAVSTACYTQNRSIVRLRHGKTPYELLHDKPLDLSFSMYLVNLLSDNDSEENWDETRSILKNKGSVSGSWLPSRRGNDFEESFALCKIRGYKDVFSCLSLTMNMIVYKWISQPTDLDDSTYQEFNTGDADVTPTREAQDERLWHPSSSPSFDREWHLTKTVFDLPPKPWITHLAQATGSQSSFDELMDTPIHFSAFMMNRLKND